MSKILKIGDSKELAIRLDQIVLVQLQTDAARVALRFVGGVEYTISAANSRLAEQVYDYIVERLSKV